MLKKYECDAMMCQDGMTITINKLDDKKTLATIDIKQGYDLQIEYVCGNQIKVAIIKKD